MVSAIASIALGSRAIEPSQIIDILLSRLDGQDSLVIMTLRIPRTIIASMAGIGFGIAGALIQSLTRNPLADPGLLGVNAGSALAVTCCVGVMGAARPLYYLPMAFLGAALASLIVFWIGSSGNPSAAKMVLAGVALSTVCAGIVSLMSMTNDRLFSAVSAWNSGSLEARSYSHYLVALPFLCVGIAIAFALASSLNILALGDDTAASLGINITVLRLLVLVAVTLLAGSATAVAGPISFIGLMVPHLARFIAGVDERKILLLTALISPSVLLIADTIARLVVSDGELPARLICSFIGAPILVVIARRRRVISL